MARRKPYSKVEKNNQIRAEHVSGMGDIAYKGFQCLNSECQEFIFVRKDELSDDFEIVCPSCNFSIRSGEETCFYDYELKIEGNPVVETGNFTILHDDYIDESLEFKYCIVCNTMKPLDFFDKHSSRKSKRQGECRLCKAVYNSIKNQTRLTDQHREASQKRRMYLEFTGSGKIDSKVILERFHFRCFKCNQDLSDGSITKRAIDHTLPAKYLWPLTTENATLLCRQHNGEKAEKWPGEYYSDAERKKLAILTGISYDILSGPVKYNPDALAMLQSQEYVDNLLIKYAAYMPEIIKWRNRILSDTSVDLFNASSAISTAWLKTADEEYERILQQKTSQ